MAAQKAGEVILAAVGAGTPQEKIYEKEKVPVTAQKTGEASMAVATTGAPPPPPGEIARR